MGWGVGFLVVEFGGGCGLRERNRELDTATTHVDTNMFARTRTLKRKRKYICSHYSSQTHFGNNRDMVSV